MNLLDSEWRMRAVCRDMPDDEIDLFFPDEDLKGPDLRLAENAAKAHCRRCPVQRECLVDALKRGEEFGIWGGLNKRERTRLVRQAVTA